MPVETPQITRRSFMKLGAMAVTGGSMAEGLHGEAAASAEPLPSKPFDREVDSCCQFCQVRCTTRVQVKGGRVVNVYGRTDNFWTAGAMCPKGKSLVELTNSPHRILHPLLRKGNGWERISYGQALEMTAERILRVKKENPKDFAHRVVLFMPLWESRESEVAALMALEMAGFPDACSPGDACIGNTATALNICLGSPNSPNTLDEVLDSDNLILWGANIAEIYPPYMRWIVMAREKGVRVIYLDPRKTPTSNFCDMQLMPRPGTDGALALGLIRILIREGLYDADYVSAYVTGFEELEKAADPYTPEKTAEITWIAPEEIVRLARILGKRPKTMMWMGGSISRYTNGIQTVRSLVALQAITNNLLGPGKGIMNVQGGKPGGEHEFLEHYRAKDLAEGMAFRKVLYNMKQERVDVLLLNGAYRRYPDANGVKEAVSKVGFVVHRGFFMNEEAQLAHLIIPGTMPFESEGSQYGAQRQVVWRNKAVERPGETVEDWRFYADLGRSINPGAFPDVTSAEEIYELFRKQVPSWKGMTLDRIKKSATGLTWPNYAEDQPDTRGSIFAGGGFLTEDGKVRLAFKPLGPMGWHEPKGSPAEKKKKENDFPLVFTQGKVVHQWQHTYTNWAAGTGQFAEGNFVQVNPETAARYGIEDGEEVYIETSIGKLKARAKHTEAILPGVIWTPSHPSPSSPIPGNRGESINTIIPNYWDKVSAQFNGFGCRLKKA